MWFEGDRITPNYTETYLTFDLTVRASHLWVASYNDYQQYLYETIIGFREKGWNFQRTAGLFNENGITPVRGKKFLNAHAHSFVKKKKFRDVHILKKYEPKLSNFALRFLEKTLINQSTHPTNFLSEFLYEKPERYHLPDDCRTSWKCGGELEC